MQITLDEITVALRALIAEEREREDVEDWALELMNQHEAGELTYSPASAEDLIWDAIDFMSQVGMEIEEGLYLFGPADFEEYWTEFQTQMTPGLVG